MPGGGGGDAVRGGGKVSGAFASLVQYCRSRGYPEPQPEVRFHPVRRWRWDACWPDRRLAVEFHGGVYSGGRHTRGAGFEADQEKFATAAVVGWRLIPVTTKQLNAGMLWELLDQEFAHDRSSHMSGDKALTPGGVLREHMADGMTKFWPDRNRAEILQVIAETWPAGMEAMAVVLMRALKARLGEPLEIPEVQS